MPDDDTIIVIHAIGLAAFLVLDGCSLLAKIDENQVVHWEVQNTPLVRKSIGKYKNSTTKKHQDEIYILKSEMKKLKAMAGRE